MAAAVSSPLSDERSGCSAGSCALLAAGVYALWDLMLLGKAEASSSALVATAVALIASSAAILALLTKLALVVTKPLGRGSWWRSWVGAGLGLPVIVPVSLLLFRGTGIAGKWYAGYGPMVVAPLLFVLLAVSLLLSGRLARWLHRASWGYHLLVGLPVLALVALLTWIDRNVYPNQYHYLHGLLLLVGFLLTMGAAWILVPPWRALRALSALLLVLALLSGGVALRLAPTSHRLRQLFAERTYTVGRLAALYRRLADRDHDSYSVILGEHDCDNSNPQVHPFALEIPGNGIDEDCDGRDEPLVPPSRREQALDAEGYRERVARWQHEPELARRLQQTARYNVVLILLDSLRADQLQPSAANQENHPELLRLFQGGRSFTRAFSFGAGTDIGMAILLSGQLNPFARGNLLLLSAFQQAGWYTYGIFQREVERWVSRQLPLHGLSGRRLIINDPLRRDIGTQATSHEVTEQGIRFLEQHATQRFFLWLHYFDIHEHHQIAPATLGQLGVPAPEPGRPAYRRLIRYVSQEVSRVVEALRRLDLERQTIVILVADHGEGLAESARLPQNHGDTLFNPLVHVPLALRLPGVSSRVLDIPVSLADVYPTLLDLAGIARPPCYGVSLVPYLFDVHLDELQGFVRPIFMAEARQQGVILWPWKLLLWRDQGLAELYDLAHDYAEQANRIDEEPAVAGRLSRLLTAQRLITIDRLTKRR